MKAPVIFAACAGVAVLVFAARPAVVDAQGASSELVTQCASCHALTKPANPTVDHLWTRKGPDLWYAGDKFNRDWLVGWLQNPTPGNWWLVDRDGEWTIGTQGGETISVEDVAKRAGTIGYEILTRLNERVPREYVGGPTAVV